MPPARMLNKTTETGAHNRELPFLDPTGDVVFFDVQSAEPGTFTVPGVIDLEVYEPGSLVESAWIYFKGDPQAGPQPGHPFERPFNDSVKFSIDIVDGNDTSTVIHPLMPPANSSLFWKGGAPFGRNGNHSLRIPRLDYSCKYYCIGEMLYRWSVPRSIEVDSVFRLKLMTDEPPTNHLSGKLRIANADASPSPSFWPVSQSTIYEVSTDRMMGVGLVGFALTLLILCLVVRLRRRSVGIALE